MKFNPVELFEIFKRNEINFFCGVPDSLLKEFTNIIDKKSFMRNS